MQTYLYLDINKISKSKDRLELKKPSTNSIHRIDLPRIVLVGENVIRQIGSICKEFGYKKALIVTGKKTYQIAGELAEQILNKQDIQTCTKIVSDATRETIEDVKNKISSAKSEVTFGVGGGPRRGSPALLGGG